MPRSSFPEDRFDDLPQTSRRVGAHRAENPHMRGWVVFFWAALATLVLIVVGIFGTLVASGRIALAPQSTPVATPVASVTPVIDPTYTVLVLNATPEAGLATRLKDQIVNAGWAADSVSAGEAGSDDFPRTTVYFALPADESAARGLAQAIGGAEVAQSDVYQPADRPDAKQLTVVVGLDRTAGGAPTP